MSDSDIGDEIHTLHDAYILTGIGGTIYADQRGATAIVSLLLAGAEEPAHIAMDSRGLAALIAKLNELRTAVTDSGIALAEIALIATED